MTERLLFARIGWMLWYRGVQIDDPKPIGGGAYTSDELGNEAFNFLPAGKRYLGYFQPQLQPNSRRDANPSSIRLEKVEPGFAGNILEHVLVIFIARNPVKEGQYIVGWYRDATVYRFEQKSSLKARLQIGYFLETAATIDHAVLVPKRRRLFTVPGGKGGFGQANICYTHSEDGQAKGDSSWMSEAIEYVNAYKHENAANSPESATDEDIADAVQMNIERAAGYQSNPLIRMAVEEYSMRWAERRLRELGLKPADKHKTESFDFLCAFSGGDLFVEVKGTQGDGTCVFLTPNEVAHAKKYSNSALFIVYGVKVVGEQKPKVEGGKELFIMPWDISAGELAPRGYTFTLPEDAFSR